MLSLAFAIIQDSSSQQANNAAAGIGIVMGLFFFVLIMAVLAFGVYCYWRIFTKAGLNGALSLLILIPGIGGIIMLCILAFGEWKVVPIAQATHLPPPYPPPSYPPASFPQQPPPAA